ncbi:hypothetical protein L210DRAFT_3645904 [Boletus edulis BED1]|uniref:Uncharacterized protein n=1 Tax=Boletus edulis BED1 TaxID=1328754 RepID=A0AAD4BTT7_BOLED|nr:hypothetical protein L210DRAFT_3645904 [Boletus edulis BED1]
MDALDLVSSYRDHSWDWSRRSYIPRGTHTAFKMLPVGVLTKTHFIQYWKCMRTSPDPSVSIHTPLRSFGLLHNSLADPVTGSVNIRLLHVAATQTLEEQCNMTCLDFDLPKPVPNTDILPISIRSQQLLESNWDVERYTVPDEGYAGGLLLTEQEPSDIDYTNG